MYTITRKTREHCSINFANWFIQLIKNVLILYNRTGHILEDIPQFRGHSRCARGPSLAAGVGGLVGRGDWWGSGREKPIALLSQTGRAPSCSAAWSWSIGWLAILTSLLRPRKLRILLFIRKLFFCLYTSLTQVKMKSFLKIKFYNLFTIILIPTNGLPPNSAHRTFLFLSSTTIQE